MNRLIKLLVGLPLFVVVVVLSVANRETVTFSINPFAGPDNTTSIEIPLFLLLFAAGFAGMLLGWLVGWSGQARWREEARRLRKEQPPAGSAPVSGQAALPKS